MTLIKVFIIFLEIIHQDIAQLSMYWTKENYYNLLTQSMVHIDQIKTCVHIIHMHVSVVSSFDILETASD